MLIVTTFFSRINKAYETKSEFVITIGGSFLFLFAIIAYKNMYPLNLIFVGIFSGFIGWSIGPTVSSLGEYFKMRKYKKEAGLFSKTVVTKKTTPMERLFGAKDEKKQCIMKSLIPLNFLTLNPKNI